MDVGLAGLPAVTVKVGVADDAGVKVGVEVGVLVAAGMGNGGQVCNLTINCWQSLPAHMFKFIEVLLGARQRTTCLSFNVSTVPQPMPASVAGDTDAVGVRTVKVAAAGITNKACAAVSIQNWHTSEAIEPVIGIPGVNVVFGVMVMLGVSAVEVLVMVIVPVEVACTVAVGDACCPAQAVVNSTRVNVPNKNKREMFFILLLTPYG